MSFDDQYFSAYAASAAEWLDGYRSRRYFYRGVERALRRHRPGADAVAELGCGLGMMSYHLLQARPSLRLDALDVSDYAVGVAREQLGRFPGAQIRIGDAQDTNLPSTSYDAVISLDVLEHLPQPDRMLSEAMRMLKPGGVLFVSTPNPESVGARLKRRRYAGCALNDVPLADRWFADRDATHVSIRSIEEWRSACREAGLERVADGTDFLWDTPYVGGVPVLLQKLLLNGGQRVLMPLLSLLPWQWGENYVGIWRKA